MSTLALKPSFIDPEMWIHISEAAVRLDKSEAHLRRLCGELLGAQDNARLMSPIDGGKPTWFVRRSMDFRLNLNPNFAEAHQIPAAQIDAMPQKVKAGMFDRLACVMAYREARRSWKGLQKDWMPHLLATLADQFPDVAPSRSRLLAWHDTYKFPADVLKLADTRGGNRRGEADPAAWDAFRKLFLTENQLSIRACNDQVTHMARENGWRWLPYASVCEQLDTRIPPAEQAKYRDPKQYNMHFSPYIAQNPELYTVNETWVGDNTPLDLWCRFEGRIIRPGLTAWVDWRSRRVCGWALAESPNSSTILAAFRMGMLDPLAKGGPAQVGIDNGKDFDAYIFHGQTKKERLTKTPLKLETPALGVFTLLGINVHHSLAYCPQGKARTERFFGTMHRDFDKTFVTWCGQSPENRPEKLADILANKPHLIPSFEHVLDRLKNWIAGYNAWAEHDRQDMAGQSPDGMFAALTLQRRMVDPESLDICMQNWQRPTVVGRNGITVAPAGLRLSYGYMSPELMPFKASNKHDRPNVLVSYDPLDVRTIRVYDHKYRFVCVAPLNDAMGLSLDGPIAEETLRRVQRAKNAHNKHSAEYTAGQYREVMTNFELIADQQAKDAAALLPPEPAPGNVRLVTTPLDGNGREIRRQEVKRVVNGDPVAPSALPMRAGLTSPLEFRTQNNYRPTAEAMDIASPLGLIGGHAAADETEEGQDGLSWTALASRRLGGRHDE